MKTVALSRSLTIGLVILFVGTFVVPSVASATTIYVDDDNTTGPWDGTLEHPYQFIQDGIDSASSGDTVYVFNGTYYENVGVYRTLSLTGEDKDSTIIDAGGSGSVVRIAANSVTITGFMIRNGGSTWPWAGINVYNSNYTTISGNIIASTQCGILLLGSSENTLFENMVTENFYCGIFVDASANNNIISGNTIYDNYFGIRSLGDHHMIYHNNIIDNTRNAQDQGSDNQWDDGYPSGGNYWSDYEGTDADGDGIGDTPYDIADGSKQDKYPLMYLWGEVTIFVDDDADPSWYDSIHVNTIQEGIDSAADGGAVYVYNGTYNENVIVDKRVHLVGQRVDSVIIDGSGSGDVVSLSADLVHIRGFTIQNSGFGAGIAVWSDYNTILTNNIANNEYGIHLTGSARKNTIFASNIVNNDYGIYVANSSDSSKIYHNNLINNTHNAYDLGNENRWDDGYPSGGNYWSDYEGIDANRDGIGDVPYDIPGGANQDRYPLMYPWGYIPVFVDDDASPIWYDSTHVSTIQEGIDSATDGSAVYVYNGTYHENVIVDKSVILIGHNVDSVIVDGNGSGDVVSISADFVHIRGFTLRNSGSGAGIAVSSDYNTIHANNIADNDYGIYIDSADSNRIYHNNFINNTQNAYDDSFNQWDDDYPSGGNYWSDYTGVDADEDGIGDTPYDIPGGTSQDRYPLIYPWGGDTIVFVDDDADSSWYDFTHVRTIQEGINNVLPGGMVYVYNGTYYENVSVEKRVILEGEDMENAVVDGGGSGDVFSISADSVQIGGFTVQNSGSGGGIVVSSDYNTILENNIADNLYGIYIANSSDSNKIYHNNFINNTQNAYDECSNIWDDGCPSGGNFWDDYTGIDEDGNGLGDTPYDIPGGANQDQFPLMSPWDGTPVGPMCGDVNLSGEVNSADIVYLINYLFKNGPEPQPAKCVGDVNWDGVVSSADIVFLIGYLFRGAPAPWSCCCPR